VPLHKLQIKNSSYMTKCILNKKLVKPDIPTLGSEQDSMGVQDE